MEAVATALRLPRNPVLAPGTVLGTGMWPLLGQVPDRQLAGCVTWASALTFLCFGCLICKMGRRRIGSVRISRAHTHEHLEEHLALDDHDHSASCYLLVVKSFASGVTLSRFKSTFCLSLA